NWWGTTVESEIQAKIYDWTDDGAKGIVNYAPYLAAPDTTAPISPSAGFNATIIDTDIVLSWDANPESDLAGYKVYWGTDAGYPHTNSVDVGNVTNYTLTGIDPTKVYHVAVTAYDRDYNPANDDPDTTINENQTNGNESWFAELTVMAPSIDTTPPKSEVAFPYNWAFIYDSIVTISGAANDDTGSGVKSVEISIDGGTKWVAVNGTSSWQYTWNVTSSGVYTILSRATDNASNVEVPSTGVTFTVSLPDLVAPTGSIAILAADNYTKTTAVPLALAANDPSGVTQMCISNTETCADWQPLAQSLPWQLTNGDGLKTVNVWYRDTLGNTNSQPYSAGITLDATSPGLSISALANGAFTNNGTLNISGTAADNYGVKELTINGFAVAINTDNTFSHALPLAVGANTVTTLASDNAGNQTSDTRTITYDPTGPVLTISMPADNSKTNKSFIDVTGTIDENASVTVKVNTYAPELASITDNTFTYAANLNAGSNTIEVTATDLAQNESSAKRTVTYDAQAPNLAITEPAQDITTTQGSILLKGAVSDALSAVTVTIATNDQTFTPPVTDGMFEQTILLPEAKSYPITVTATDEAGNSSTVQRNVIRQAIWNDITPQTTVTKSSTLYDRTNNCYYVLLKVTNPAATALTGSLRMIITTPSIPLKTNLSVGLKPDGYTSAGEPYFNIVPQGGSITAGGSLSNLRVNFEMQRVPLTYGVRVEQYK
ncbi:MAG: hypothetical protein FD174_4045, partial [Geobacteraceae bacterium]